MDVHQNQEPDCARDTCRTPLFAAHVTRQQKIIVSCGSGVTACILALAAELAGYTDIAVYDGSWCEWGLPSERAVII